MPNDPTTRTDTFRRVWAMPDECECECAWCDLSEPTEPDWDDDSLYGIDLTPNFPYADTSDETLLALYDERDFNNSHGLISDEEKWFLEEELNARTNPDAFTEAVFDDLPF